jgi:hypothetical protein
VHVPENLQNLLQTVSALSKEWRVDDVGSDVDELVEIVLTNVGHFTELPVITVKVGIEQSPVQCFIRRWDFCLVLQHSELFQHLLALLDFLHFHAFLVAFCVLYALLSGTVIRVLKVVRLFYTISGKISSLFRVFRVTGSLFFFLCDDSRF